MNKQIPVVIFCGGQGMRMRTGTETKKELVTVGGRPILWHVMRIFSSHGFNHFILPLGYGAEQIKRYFIEYEAMARNFSLLIANDESETPIQFHEETDHPAWRIDFVDTGIYTDKASRLQKIKQFVQSDRFFVTYGDGVSDVDVSALLRFHEHHGKKATITAIQPGSYQYGTLEGDATGLVSEYNQYPPLPYWINAGFMVLEREILDRIPEGDDQALEQGIIQELVVENEVMMHRHHGFWQSMDTLKDSMELEKRWQDDAPWKIW